MEGAEEWLHDGEVLDTYTSETEIGERLIWLGQVLPNTKFSLWIR